MSGDYASFKALDKRTANLSKHRILHGHGGIGALAFHKLINAGVSRSDALPLQDRLLYNKAVEAYRDYPNSPLIGIEIEVENYGNLNDKWTDKDTACFNFHWVTKEDNSLRNRGKEFVTALGTSVATLPSALEIFTKFVKHQHNAQGLVVNARTGLHVHINVAGFTQYALCNMLFLYGILEPLFFKVSGERKNSVFCVPWEFNRYTLGNVIYSLANTPEVFRWRNYSKYCGLNIATVDTYGTLEFRMHSGTLDAETITKWVKTITNLYHLALKTDLIANVTNFRRDRHAWKYRQLINEVFAEYLPEVFANENENITRCVYATLGVYKGFVDHAKLPETVTHIEQEQYDIDDFVEHDPEPPRMAPHLERPRRNFDVLFGDNLVNVVMPGDR